MKNKGVTYALLIVVALIWYQVFFRVKSNLFGEETAVVTPGNAAPVMASIERDTFRLKANYRDPFSGSRQAVVASAPTDPVVAPPPPPPVRREEVWPQMVYYGQVKKTGSKEPLAILKVDNMQFYLRQGESVFDNYVVKRIFRDSVEVVHGKRRRMVQVKK